MQTVLGNRFLGSVRAQKFIYFSWKRGNAHNNIANGGSPAPRTNASQSRQFPHNDACNLCGERGHWARVCKAHDSVAKTYKAYRNMREAHLVDHENLDAELKAEDFNSIHEHAEMDVVGFE
ncbi:hypothetical protein AQUCO_05900002v1 [Aquilegia coerulea]|uniref:CCHC-type domain-containing protein n=1 Tax=Aquilegia coerulea TaxID=218851 RepID=A0A2G5CDY7_AQUCA|nr:hypothetical protein AQUCO_05900002v1 [Aquilegia coerulea]